MCLRTTVLLSFLLLFGVSTAAAQFEKRLIIDKDFSPVAGANDLLTIHEALRSAQEVYLPQRFNEEDNFTSKLGGIAYRLSKSIFLENIVDNLVYLTQHEVFGHGARYRERGIREHSYYVDLFPPFGTGGGFASGGAHGPLTSMSGSQANRVLAHEQRFRLLSAGEMHYRQSNLYLAGMSDLTHYILQTRAGSSLSNDVWSTLYGVYGQEAESVLKDLKTEVYINFLDPLQWYAVYNLLINSLYMGNTSMPIPMLDILGSKYLPQFRLGLTPHGTEFYFENHVVTQQNVWYAYVAATKDLGSHRGGAEVRYVPLTDWLGLDAALHLWYQPEREGIYERVWGMMASVTPSLRLTDGEYKTSLIAQIGLKSRGFIEGEPIAAGPVFRAGLSFR